MGRTLRSVRRLVSRASVFRDAHSGLSGDSTRPVQQCGDLNKRTFYETSLSSTLQTSSKVPFSSPTSPLPTTQTDHYSHLSHRRWIWMSPRRTPDDRPRPGVRRNLVTGGGGVDHGLSEKGSAGLVNPQTPVTVNTGTRFLTGQNRPLSSLQTPRPRHDPNGGRTTFRDPSRLVG